MIITIASNKGGVAKTTTAVSIAHGLALNTSHRVRITNFDRQSHVAVALGLDPEPGVFNHLVSRQPLPNLLRSSRRTGLELLPGNGYRETAQDIVAKLHDLADIPALIRQIADGADLLVIAGVHWACSSGYLQEQAIRVADIIISLARPDFLSVDGLNQIHAMIKQLNQTACLCILPTCFDGRISEHTRQWNLWKEFYPDESFNCVPQRAAVIKAAAEGNTIWESKARGIEDVQQIQLFDHWIIRS